MKFNDFLCNKTLPVPIEKQAEKFLEKDERILFAIVGDLKLNADYGSSALIVTENRLLCVEENSDGGFSIPVKDIESAEVTRMYGNAVLRINGRIVLRFSFKTVAFTEIAAEYLTNVAAGADPARELEAVKATFDKARSVCPKCGRTLVRPGAECINCIGKGQLVKKLWKYVKPQGGLLVLCLILSGITTASALVPPYITKMLVDDVLPQKNLKYLYILVGILLGVYLVQAIIGSIRANYVRIAGNRIVADLRNDVYSKAQYLPIGFYDKTSTGSMFARINTDTFNLQAFILKILQDAVIQLFTMIGIMIIMFTLNPRLALLSLIPVPIVALGARSFGKKMHPVYRRIWMRWSSVCGMLSDTLPGVKVIKSFTSEKRTIGKFEAYIKSWLTQEEKATPIMSVFPHAVTFFVTCGSLIIWALGGSWVITDSGGMTTGLLVSFISYASMFYNPVNFFASLSDGYQQALTSAEKLLDVLDAEPEKDFGKGNIVKPIKGKIEFRHVNFSFDKTTKTLDDINVTIEPGDIVGIVGTTGSGKSTLINLLMRFYDDYEGEILVDGHNIKEIDLESYRSQIGFVQQDPLMFRDTIFKNIAFSNPDLPVEAVIRAADVANAHCFIARMPDAYDTVLGERGAGLSGGERQRISIARAVIKNPSLLIFDEATAAVDSETEHLIQEAIERLISGRTTLMIAHRLSTLRKANKIIVVDKGKIIEFGTPEELMALKGKYYKLIEIQNMSEEARKRSEEENFG